MPWFHCTVVHKWPKTMATASIKAATATVCKYKSAWECWPLLPICGFKPSTCNLISCIFHCFLFYWKACLCDIKEVHTEAPTLSYSEQQLRACSHWEAVVTEVKSACCGCEGTWRSILIMTQAYKRSHASNNPRTPHICDSSLWTWVWLSCANFCSVFIALTVTLRHLRCDVQQSVFSPLTASDLRVQITAVWKIKRSDNCS